MNKYLRLFRMGNVLIGSFAILIAAFMATGTAMIDYWYYLIVGFFVVFAFIAGGNSLNDYIDVDIDTQTQYFPHYYLMITMFVLQYYQAQLFLNQDPVNHVLQHYLRMYANY